MENYFALSFMPAETTGFDNVALAIMQTNAIAAGNGIGIFPRTARLNHGCSSAFNAVYSWRDREGFLTVHAIKDIRRGDVSLESHINMLSFSNSL